MLADLGQPEAPLASAEEAVALYRALAAQRSDAFWPDLATSFTVMANCLDTVERQMDGLWSNAEAIRVLTGPLETLPTVFAGRKARFV